METKAKNDKKSSLFFNIFIWQIIIGVTVVVGYIIYSLFINN